MTLFQISRRIVSESGAATLNALVWLPVATWLGLASAAHSQSPFNPASLIPHGWTATGKAPATQLLALLPAN